MGEYLHFFQNRLFYPYCTQVDVSFNTTLQGFYSEKIACVVLRRDDTVRVEDQRVAMPPCCKVAGSRYISASTCPISISPTDS